MVGVGGGATGDESAEGAVDHGWKVKLEIWNGGETLDAGQRRRRRPARHKQTFWRED